MTKATKVTPSFCHRTCDPWIVDWSDIDILDDIRKHIALWDNNITDQVTLINDKDAKFWQY